MSIKDSWVGNSLTKKTIKEHITPHKIAVVILIQEYCNIKSQLFCESKNKGDDAFMELTVKVPDPKFRRGFSMLILHLIHCPDMEFSELVDLLNSDKYFLVPDLFENFLDEVLSFMNKEVGCFMDVILNVGRLLIDPMNLRPLVNRSSPIGVYLRRVMLYFDKLNFSQTVSLYRKFQHYIQKMERVINAKQKTDKVTALPTSTSSSPQLPSLNSVDMDSVQMELSSVAEPFVPPLPVLDRDTTKLLLAEGSDMEEEEDVVRGDGGGGECTSALWSRRQAELFIARQTARLQNNEESALPPAQLQQVIRQVLQANPDHFEAHFLSYLNCLRVKEFGGAIESLYHYFDRNTCNSQDKEPKGYRYAALNLAILHAQFGHKEDALIALKESIFLSHEVNDNISLQHAQAWLYKLTEENKEILMERSISKCSDLSLNYLTSLGLQSFAQFAGTTGGKPALVFEVLMRSDVLNCQFSMMELMSQSFTHKAALWTLYGKADMAALSSQLLLHLDLTQGDGLNSYSGEATCQAICNIALRLTELGKYDLALLVVDHARDRFPNSSSWQLAEQVLYFTRNVYQGKWQAAQEAVRQLTTLDKWESLLREGELLVMKGDSVGALAAVTTVLDGSPSLCPSVRVRALLLAARSSHAAAVSILTAALSIANYHYLDYLTALVAMQLAQLQLQMNLPNQALKLMDQSLLVVLSHGGYYDQATALMLFVQCKVASVATAEPDVRSEVIADSIHLLNKVRENFQSVEAYSGVKEAIYLQCLLANELGCFAERNKFAYEFRQLEEEFSSLQIQ